MSLSQYKSDCFFPFLVFEAGYTKRRGKEQKKRHRENERNNGKTSLAAEHTHLECLPEKLPLVLLGPFNAFLAHGNLLLDKSKWERV